MLHQTTQRRLCRALFLTLCLTPTTLVVGWCVWRAQSDAVRTRLDALGRAWGVELVAQRCDTPRPGVLRLSGVALRAPETHADLAAMDLLLVDTRGGAPSLRARRLALRADALGPLTAAVDRALRLDWPGDATLRVDRLELVGGPQGWAAADVRGVWRSGPAAGLGSSIELTVGPGDRADAPRLLAVRNRQMEPPTTRVELHTASGAAPWALVRALDTALPDLGPGALLRGSLVATLEQREGRVAGRVEGASLAALAPPGMLLEADAPASLSALEVEWSGERLTQLAVRVDAGAGRIGWPLAMGLHHKLGCGAGPQLLDDWAAAGGQETPGAPLAFDRLAFDVRLGPTGITLRGATPPAADDPAPRLAERGGRALLYQPASPRVSLVALLHAIAPPGAELRPTGGRLESVARRLPLNEAPATR